MIKLLLGDSKDKLKELEENSIDLVVSDPPYGISFMGKDWDSFNEITKVCGGFTDKTGLDKLPRNKPNGMLEFFTPIWKETLRVLKPGGFAFVMCAPRQDVLARQIVALQDAGFRTDFTSMYWTYASGFPKAHNISKTIDKQAGAEREVVGINNIPPRQRERGTNRVEWKGSGERPIDNKVYGHDKRTLNERMEITAPATEEAKQFEGLYGGMQVKPAVECVLVAMKPMDEKTYVAQVLKRYNQEQQALEDIRKLASAQMEGEVEWE